MTRRPLCLVCLILMLCMWIADLAGIPLVSGVPLPDTVQAYIEKHPNAVICGEVQQYQTTEFSFSVCLKQVFLIVRSEKIPIENVKVFLKKEEDLPPGTFAVFSGRLEAVAAPRNPGEFDSRQYHSCQHIYYFMKKAVLKKKSSGYSGYRQKLLELKEQVLEILRDASGKDAPIFEAMLLGEKTDLDQEVKMRYQMAGMIHILAISGVKTLKLDIPLVPETRIKWAFVPLHIAIIYILKLCLDEEIIPRCRFPCSRGYHKKHINWQKKQ